MAITRPESYTAYILTPLAHNTASSRNPNKLIEPLSLAAFLRVFGGAAGEGDDYAPPRYRNKISDRECRSRDSADFGAVGWRRSARRSKSRSRVHLCGGFRLSVRLGQLPSGGPVGTP